MDLDYEELQNFNFVQSDEEEEFSIINPNLLYLDLEDSDNVNNVPVSSTVIDNLLLPNE